MEKEEDITMKKTYKIEVDCAACALKMEDAAKKVEGVTDATVSFMTQKMKVPDSGTVLSVSFGLTVSSHTDHRQEDNVSPALPSGKNGGYPVFPLP